MSARQRGPGEFEHVVLLTLAGFDREASGGDVYEALLSHTAREPVLGAVYLTLGRLGDKGWVEVRTEDPAPGRGGKPRKFFRLAPAGAELLRRLRDEQDGLWEIAAGRGLRSPGSGGER